MNLTAIQIAEAFLRHEFEKTYPYLADTIQWNLVGNEQLDGKEKVMDACQKSAAYLTSVTTNFSKFIIIADTDHVVIDSTAEYTDKEQNKTSIASCDIYRFAGGKLVEITSYTIERDGTS